MHLSIILLLAQSLGKEQHIKNKVTVYTKKNKDLINQPFREMGHQKSCIQHRSIKNVFASVETDVDAAKDEKKMVTAKGYNIRNQCIVDHGERCLKYFNPCDIETQKAEQSACD
jgi:hypothetical protein